MLGKSNGATRRNKDPMSCQLFQLNIRLLGLDNDLTTPNLNESRVSGRLPLHLQTTLLFTWAFSEYAL